LNAPAADYAFWIHEVRDAIDAIYAASAAGAWSAIGGHVDRLLQLLERLPSGTQVPADLVRRASAAVEHARGRAAAERDAVGAELELLRRGRRAVRAYG
jgi:hypothetical protein